MRGRNAINRKNAKPMQRQKDLYELLIEIGGEIQWKNLRAITLERLKWSPTKLKKTLDELIENKQVFKEPRLGRKGAEVWYIATTPANLYKLALRIAQPFIPIKTEKPTKDDYRTLLLSKIREKASRLQGKEKEDFLRKSLYDAIRIFGTVSHLIPFFLTLRTAILNYKF